MKKKTLPLLILHRETLKRLDAPGLKAAAGGDLVLSASQCSFICCPTV